jgi:thiamine pyrophosphate-dependent acetolactate synthase large subunit-like protein
MLGMHGLYEANLAMHGCDLMINIGARFDDRSRAGSTPSRPARERPTSISTRPRSTR